MPVGCELLRPANDCGLAYLPSAWSPLVFRTVPRETLGILLLRLRSPRRPHGGPPHAVGVLACLWSYHDRMIDLTYQRLVHAS